MIRYERKKNLTLTLSSTLFRVFASSSICNLRKLFRNEGDENFISQLLVSIKFTFAPGLRLSFLVCSSSCKKKNEKKIRLKKNCSNKFQQFNRSMKEIMLRWIVIFFSDCWKKNDWIMRDDGLLQFSLLQKKNLYLVYEIKKNWNNEVTWYTRLCEIDRWAR